MNQKIFEDIWRYLKMFGYWPFIRHDFVIRAKYETF